MSILHGPLQDLVAFWPMAHLVQAQTHSAQAHSFLFTPLRMDDHRQIVTRYIVRVGLQPGLDVQARSEI